MLLNMLGLPTRWLLMRLRSRSSRDYQTPYLEENCTYLANLSGPAYEKEINTLSWYTWRAYAVLILSGASHWEALWSD